MLRLILNFIISHAPGENVAAAYSVSRDAQDAFAARSFQLAEAAQLAGSFASEIVPVTTLFEGKDITVVEDDGIRKGVSAATLAKLKPAFKTDGTTTAGNASQVRLPLQ